MVGTDEPQVKRIPQVYEAQVQQPKVETDQCVIHFLSWTKLQYADACFACFLRFFQKNVCKEKGIKYFK